jgi:hypothetical protein
MTRRRSLHSRDCPGSALPNLGIGISNLEDLERPSEGQPPSGGGGGWYGRGS